MNIPSLTRIILEISAKEKTYLIRRNLHTIFLLACGQYPTIRTTERSSRDGKKINVFSIKIYLEKKKLNSFLQKFYFCILTLSHEFDGIYSHKTKSSIHFKTKDLIFSPEVESLKDTLFIENRDLINALPGCNLIFQFSKKNKSIPFLLPSMISFPKKHLIK